MNDEKVNANADEPIAVLEQTAPGPNAQSPWPHSPWLFVPVLYVMQGIQMPLATEMFTVTFQDLNLANPLIAAWTSILSLPWTLKLFWAPLVDLNSTKRRWTVVMEMLIAAMFGLTSIAVLFPQYADGHPQWGFIVTIGLLLCVGIFAATHDIACDGLYMLSLSPAKQAEFVGWQGTWYKLGRMFCVGAMVSVAGKLKEMHVSAGHRWMIVLMVCFAMYGVGAIYNFFMLPAPPTDRPAKESEPGENRRDVMRTLLVLLLGGAIIMLLNGGVRLVGGEVFNLLNRGHAGAAILPQWQQSNSDMFFWGIMLTAGAVLFVVSSLLVRWALAGSAMAESFMSFVRQPGFWGIMAFIMFYRFGEAMVTRVLPLFFLDPINKGGLGVSMLELGVINTAGIFGIIFGGIAGGLVVSRLGLRKSFWPLALAMYAPNIFYLIIAMGKDQFANPHGWPNLLFHNWILYVATFTHEFGYGIGLATYSLFLMNIAQRSVFRTAHYAFGTGLSALCILAAGIVSAILLASVNYVWFFIAVCALSVPGMITLLIIPMES